MKTTPGENIKTTTHMPGRNRKGINVLKSWSRYRRWYDGFARYLKEKENENAVHETDPHTNQRR
jgi:hypothetical protein